MAAGGALVQVASHGGGSTSLDGDQNLQMQPGEPLGRMIHQPVTRGGDDIGQLQQWPCHSVLTRMFFRVRGRRKGERVQRAGGGFQMPFGKVQVTAGRLQAGMPE